MKVFAIAPLLGLAISLALLPFTLGEADRYKVQIEEKGTRFSEEIDVDEEKDVEVFRVPAHNNVDGADFYHDFKLRVTVSRILSRKVCHISKMDSSLSSPGKLKEDIKQAALQPGQIPVTTKPYLVMVTGPANRLLLTQEILDFCGALPIYNTELSPWDSTETDIDPSDGSATIRQRRQSTTIEIANFTSCSRFSSLARVENCMMADWSLQCKMIRGSCYYFVTCENIKKIRLSWICKQVHITYDTPACCDYICP